MPLHYFRLEWVGHLGERVAGAPLDVEVRLNGATRWCLQRSVGTLTGISVRVVLMGGLGESGCSCILHPGPQVGSDLAYAAGGLFHTLEGHHVLLLLWRNRFLVLFGGLLHLSAFSMVFFHVPLPLTTKLVCLASFISILIGPVSISIVHTLRFLK